MKRKNIWIVSLLALGLALAAAALFWLLPAQERQQAQQRAARDIIDCVLIGGEEHG